MTDDKGQKKTISDCGFGKAEGQRTEGSYTRHYALSTRHKKGKGAWLEYKGYREYGEVSQGMDGDGHH